jgi:acetyltransferase-like isoleucine patch superfamily enzyme
MNRMSFRERNELIEFWNGANEQPAQPGLVQSLLFRYFKWKFMRLKLGSPDWHGWQQRLSLRAASGIGPPLRTLFYELTLSSCGIGLYVHPHCVVYYPKNLLLGNNVYMNRGIFITARALISIGNDVLIGPYTVINSANHEFVSPTSPIRLQGHVKKPITIEDDVWIGANVTIVAGVTLGKGSVVAAGAVVTHDVPPYHVVAGVPARVMKKRGN